MPEDQADGQPSGRVDASRPDGGSGACSEGHARQPGRSRQDELAECRGAGLVAATPGAELPDERVRVTACPARPPRKSPRQAGWRPCSWSRGKPVRSASRQKDSGTGAGGAEADEHLAIAVDDVIDGQADQAGVRRHSDDHHIVRELGVPSPPDRAASHPAPLAEAGPDTRK